MRVLGIALVTVACSSVVFGQATGSTTLKVGDPAPDFTLTATTGEKFHLADHIGKSTIVLAFFPAAFTGG